VGALLSAGQVVNIEPPDWNRIENKIGSEVKPTN
jgi:hypothetical protein